MKTIAEMLLRLLLILSLIAWLVALFIVVASTATPPRQEEIEAQVHLVNRAFFIWHLLPFLIFADVMFLWLLRRRAKITPLA